MNPADIAFIIICTGLVMLMTPGLALFYGGLVRSRNVLSTTMHSFITMGIVPVLWFVVGYSLAFGPDLGGGRPRGGTDTWSPAGSGQKIFCTA